MRRLWRRRGAWRRGGRWSRWPWGVSWWCRRQQVGVEWEVEGGGREWLGWVGGGWVWGGKNLPQAAGGCGVDGGMGGGSREDSARLADGLDSWEGCC
jgi:hypothetical protein